MTSLWSMLNTVNSNYFPSGPDFLIPYENLIAQPKIRIMYHDIGKVDSQLSTGSGNFLVQSSILGIITMITLWKYTR